MSQEAHWEPHERYAKRGWALLDALEEEAVATLLMHVVQGPLRPRRIRAMASADNPLGEMSTVYDLVIEGAHFEEHPASQRLYAFCRRLAQNCAGREVVTSPYVRSHINAKVYTMPGHQQTWHCDTNSLSVLVYLTRAQLALRPPGERHGPAYVQDFDCGDVVLLRGRDVWHAVEPLPAPTIRACLVLNYYHPGEVSRPPGLDNPLYGKA